MGYQFDNSTQFIDYGLHTQLYIQQDMSLGMWIYYVSNAATDDRDIVGQRDTFPIANARTIINFGGSFGNGVRCEHFIGGSQRIGVSCVPGAVNARYQYGFAKWRYFAFSRNYSAKTYDSWFGSKAALVSGQSFTWLPGQEPLPFGTPGQTMGDFEIGTAMDHVIVGPMNYWDTYLTQQQHLSMARCTIPTGVSITHLQWWTKMFLGAADASPNLFTNTFGGVPLPTFVADGGCAPAATGQDYRLYNVG